MGVEKIGIFEAEPGMELARPVVVLHAKGREVMPVGFMIQTEHIRRFKRWGIKHIYVKSEPKAEEKSAGVFKESIIMLARQTYEDAIVSLSKLSRNMIENKDSNLDQVFRSISNLIDVISMEEGILAFLSRIKKQDEYLYKHSVDVCVTALTLGKAMEYTEGDLYRLGIACLLHDIGMVRFDHSKWDDALISRDPSNIYQHPIYSAELARKIKGVNNDILQIIAQHHECADGDGYPESIESLEIHPLARLASISEAYITSIFPYNEKNSINPHEAMIAVIDPTVRRFDHRVMRAFVSIMAIYPSGTFVKLSNDFTGVVMSGNKDHPLRPNVLIINENIRLLIRPYRMDLCDPKCQDIFIEHIVPPESISEDFNLSLVV